jgi:hypothetical protein
MMSCIPGLWIGGNSDIGSKAHPSSSETGLASSFGTILAVSVAPSKTMTTSPLDRQFAEVKYLADAAAQRHRPLLAALGLPVDSGDGGAGKIEIREVVIKKWLDQAVVV